jgi:HlyD family secretion protein
MDLPRTPTSHIETQETSTDGRRVTARPSVPRPSPPARSSAWRKWLIQIAILLVILVAIALARWYTLRPQEVSLIQPTVTTITETIASSGRVRGVTETVVGAQAAGIVETLYVDEGDRVTAGQLLAMLKRDVAEARLAQAEQALNTARAELAQAESRPLRSEVEAAAEQVRQAQAQLVQQRVAVQQAQQSVAQSRAQLHQLQAELNLAATQLERSAALFDRNFISRAEYDQAQTQYRVTEQRVATAQKAVPLGNLAGSDLHALDKLHSLPLLTSATLRLVATSYEPS